MKVTKDELQKMCDAVGESYECTRCIRELEISACLDCFIKRLKFIGIVIEEVG